MVKLNKYFWLFARVFAGAFFAYAGISKLLEPLENFQAVLGNYGSIPSFLVGPVAHVLPWLEWLLGVFLILGYAPRMTAKMMTGICLIFIVSLTLSLKSNTDCGCFGEGGMHLSKKQMLILDGLNFILLLRLSFLKRFALSLDAWLQPPETARTNSK